MTGFPCAGFSISQAPRFGGNFFFFFLMNAQKQSCSARVFDWVNLNLNVALAHPEIAKHAG